MIVNCSFYNVCWVLNDCFVCKNSCWSSFYQGLSGDSVPLLHMVAMFHQCLTLLVSSQSVEKNEWQFFFTVLTQHAVLPLC